MELNAESGYVRKPLPSPEEIKKLPKDGGKEFNRLIFEQSPYLLQHARNPVDWWPWSDAAFEAAAKADKPVFLSVGYTTCHWCHVMEHESFEDPEVAKLMNEHFICVKVDREERPDIDQVYMTVTQALTNSGGWPMTVMMTDDKKPFFAGTYFPKDNASNRIGMTGLIPQVAGLWENDREKLLSSAEEITAALKKMSSGAPGEALTKETLDMAYAQLAANYDDDLYGFRSMRKFPMPHSYLYLLRHWQRTGDAKALKMVEQSLEAMRLGGIYDQVGFGIHRYSTDPHWLLPHFEKMLYDQALVTMANVEAYEATGHDVFRTTAEEILTYVLRDMTSPVGGFYSAEDADSEGEEGKFYVWSEKEVIDTLGDDDAAFYLKVFQFAKEGNFAEEATGHKTGENIPHLKSFITGEENLERAERLRKKLFEVRKMRIHPQKDDKILTDWNGLMIAAFSQAGVAFEKPEYTEAAQKAADFVLDKLRNPDGRLLKRYRRGEAGLPSHLEDYAFMIWGLLNLYEATFEVKYLQEALALNDILLEFFWDDKEGGFFMTADDGEALIVRSKEIYDGAIPSGNSVSALNLVRLERMTGNRDFGLRAEKVMKAFSGSVADRPSGYCVLMMALDFMVGPSFEVVIAGKKDDPATDKLIEAARKDYHPNKVILLRQEGDEMLSKLAPYTKDQVAVDGEASAYVCRDFACLAPTSDPEKVRTSLVIKKEAK